MSVLVFGAVNNVFDLIELLLLLFVFVLFLCLLLQWEGVSFTISNDNKCESKGVGETTKSKGAKLRSGKFVFCASKIPV